MFARLLTAVAMLAFAAPALAAEIKRQEYGGKTVITVIGPLVNEDAARFRKVADGVLDGMVLLRSDGGSLYAGIEIGRIIRHQGLATWVSSLQGACMSACGFAWLAGKPRMLDTNSQVGFHAAYVLENGKPVVVGAANALVGAYLRDLGLSDNAILYATEARPESMRWLTKRDAQTIGLEVSYMETGQKPAAAKTSRWYDWRYVDGYMLVGSSLKRNTKGVKRIEECSLICEVALDCVAVNYDSKEKTCHLKTEVVLAVKNRRYQAGYHFDASVREGGANLSKDLLKLFRQQD